MRSFLTADLIDEVQAEDSYRLQVSGLLIILRRRNSPVIRTGLLLE